MTIIEATCTNKVNDTAACPEGTTESMCGGDGLTEACANGSECQESGEGEVTCTPLPKP